MYPNIIIYLFEHRVPRLEVVALGKKVDIQNKLIRYMENTCKELRLRVYLLTDKAISLKKNDKG